MVVINFERFAAMPAGVIFSYCMPGLCAGLYRKGRSITGPWGNVVDYYETAMMPRCEGLTTMATLSGDPELSGHHPADQLYAIYSTADQAMLVNIIEPGYHFPDAD